MISKKYFQNPTSNNYALASYVTNKNECFTLAHEAS